MQWLNLRDVLENWKLSWEVFNAGHLRLINRSKKVNAELRNCNFSRTKTTKMQT